MKTATVEIAAINITCPHCKEMVECSMTGSLMHVVYELRAEMDCDQCGKSFRLPKKYQPE